MNFHVGRTMKHVLLQRCVPFVSLVACIAAMNGCAGSGGDGGPRAVSAKGPVGESLYKRHCRRCHAIEPPPKIAPPVKGISLHYHEALGSRDVGVEHMAAFVERPDPERSKCDPEAIRRFGLMPAMHLPDEELRAVSAWFWDQYDPSMKEMERRMRQEEARHER